jgi:respiratory nitrate reductase alpha subunit
MSHFLDRLNHFALPKEDFAGGHGRTTGEDRTWEDAYRNRWAHDKIVRSTHGVNCTGSCSWKIYVKGGIVTWETQQTDYPRTRWDLPNHEPRGCQRGASYSWYLYSANRVKHPMVRGRLLKHWREARLKHDPVNAWAAIQADEAKRRDYQKVRGLGGFVRSSWDEVNEIIAAANVYTAKTYGPDRMIGFSPIPAMSMVSYAAGSRYLSLIGGVCMSFYDWYCDLPPSSPQIWGEQTDVPESADWYSSSFIIAWGSNVPQTRTPDAHFFTEVRYKGTKTVAVTPDYSEVAKLADLWMHPKQGTDAAVAMAMGHVILKEFYVDRRRRTSTTMRAATPTCRCWCCSRSRRCPTAPGCWRRGASCAPASSPAARPGQQPRLEDAGLRRERPGGGAQRLGRLPLGPRGPRRCRQVEPRGQGGQRRRQVKLKLSVLEDGEQAHRTRRRRLPVLRRPAQPALQVQSSRAATCAAPTCRR